MDRPARRRPDLAEPLAHFVKVSRSYEPGLFRGYDVAALPRTNDDREQLFGSHRHHERRCHGRKVASPGLVVRGSVRLVAGLMTRLGEATADELAPASVLAWRELREEIGFREAALWAAIEDVLSDDSRSGCPATFAPDQVARIIAAACEPPADSGRPVTHGTPTELAEGVVVRRIVPAISVRHVGRLLKVPHPNPTGVGTGSTPVRRNPRRAPGKCGRCATAIRRPRR